jgi:hypothetical protein
MKLTQISVFLENKKGRLFEVCDTLSKGKINIRALIVAESENFGILRIVVDKPEAAAQVLKKKGFVANFTDIVAVEVGDKPGGLAAILKVLNDHDLNVEYMYGFVEKASDKALMVFRFDEADKAVKILTKKGIRLIGKKEIGGL